MRSIAEEIEALSAERRALWAKGVSGEAVVALTKKIDALYAEKRAGVAEHGSPAARARAIKRALVERELDRLMATA